ncbi:MAG: hypothetical protein RQ885_04940 [Desulfurococcales archaeon]|nr:hypothetical protein [Desulfurococcales archaeon]
MEKIVNIYSKMLEDVLLHASRNIIENYYRLKNERYQELRNIYQISRPTIYMTYARMLLKEFPL